MDKLALKAKMIINNDNGKKLSVFLSIANTTLSAKMNGKAEFTRTEIFKIKERYNLSAEEIDNIFFNKQVT